MKRYTLAEAALFVSLVVTSVLLVGCVVSKTVEHYSGIADVTLQGIQCGQMTKEQLVARLGEPAEQQLTDDGSEILKYRCTKKKDEKFVLFPVFVAKGEKEVEYAVVFEVKDGIVQRYWKET